MKESKKIYESISNNNEQKDSSRSDISMNTNKKVFNGFIGNDEFVKKLNTKIVKQKKEKEKEKEKENEKEKEKEVQKPNQFFLSSLPKTDPNINRRNIMIDILSFGNGNILNNKSNDNSSQNSQNGAEQPQKDKENNTLNISNNSDHSSSIEKKSNNSSKSIENNDINNNNNSIIPPGAFMTTEGILNMNNDASSDNSNSNNSNNSPHENVFWKMRHEDENSKEKNDNSIKQNSLFDNNNKNISDIFYRGFNNVVDCFTVATIEKGVALLVSNDDCIFTLPTFLLPKGVKVGNMYKFNIDENQKKEDIDKEIKQMQQNFVLFNKKNNENQENNNG